MFFCVGRFPQQEEYAKAAQKGIDDRFLQAVQNTEIVNQFCVEVNELCPQAKVFVLTNPVDLMTEITRKNLPQAEVYGLGCALDTARFKRELRDLLELNGRYFRIDEIHAIIVGHHNSTMFLHRKSFLLMGNPPEDKLVEQALANTRARGLTITKLNAAATTPKLNNGAYFAPAAMITDVVRAIIDDRYVTMIPLNRPIREEDNVGFDFVEGQAAKLPCTITGLKVIPKDMDFSFEIDRNDLKHSLEEYEKSKEALAKYIG